MRERGVRGLWRGLDALLPRVIALVSVQLTVYDVVKARLIQSGWGRGSGTHFVSLGAAFGQCAQEMMLMKVCGISGRTCTNTHYMFMSMVYEIA